ncbi:hypothetical protein CSQ96_26025 [Janthinobacterium sp. BJB412]|nr:hypothetical protein CSQ96_26025 [Janthinobacterium sp. BJB412]
MSNTLSSTDLSLKDALELYENGKHRRYGLLLAVNGGAFAIARLLAGESGNSGFVLGNLTLRELAIGMAIFTALMVWDIYVFGDKVFKTYIPKGFQSQGKAVSAVLGALQFTAWLLVGARLAAHA